MATKIDQGHKVLTSLARTYGQLHLDDKNEAETRLKVIDEVLFSVLGWIKDTDVSVEERVTEDGVTRFADYIIRTASTSLIVEAKRAGAAFALPTNKKRLPLGGVLSEGELGQAIRQVREYCRKKSIPFAAVTNGSAWLVFPAVRIDEISFEDSEAHIFRSLDDIQERIVEFWELLSRERTLEGNLENELLGRASRDERGVNIRQGLADAGYRLGRNGLYGYIEPAIAVAMSDEALLQDAQALSACYVKTSERLKFDSRLQVHVRDHLPPLGHKTIRVRGKKHTALVDEKIAGSKANLPLRFVVLLGPVGAGKTTFLEYTRRVSAADAIDRKVIWLPIDFKRSTAADSPRSFILRQLLDMIESDMSFQLGEWLGSVSKAYAETIEALRRGALYLLAKTDPSAFDLKVAEIVGRDRELVEPYVEKILSYASTKWPIFLVIDNVDQLENSDLQEAIFIEAQALARRIRSNVIMSMRESTYLRHRDRPSFDAFQFESFYIDPPNVIPVLSHRFAYAKRVLSGRAVKLTTEKGINIHVPDLSKFFDLTAYSLLEGETGFMLECLSGGDIRRGLALVREFLASGHTNSDRAIATYLSDGLYRFPRHEVFRGCVLGSFKYFNDSSSLIPNLFDSKLGSIGLQLLRVQIVSVLVHRAAEGIVDGVAIAEMASVLNRIGVPERDLTNLIEDLHSRRIVQTTDGLAPTSQSLVAPTRLAAYMIKQLCREFAYAEFCSIDASVYDADVLLELRDLTAQIESAHGPVEKLGLRIERLRVFVGYLRRCEERWVVETKRRELPAEWGRAVVGDMIPEIEDAASTALRSAERNYRREPTTPVPSGRFEGRGRAVEDATFEGTIVSTWLDKDYVFIRDDDGADWFGHCRDFLTEDDWNRRSRGVRCAFLRGEWKGKPRAISVRVV